MVVILKDLEQGGISFLELVVKISILVGLKKRQGTLAGVLRIKHAF